MATKDWKKIGKLIYQHYSLDKLYIFKRGGNWDVEKYPYDEIKSYPVLSKSFKTKSQALKFAKSYMRKN